MIILHRKCLKTKNLGRSDRKADIWALGILCFELLIERPLYDRNPLTNVIKTHLDIRLMKNFIKWPSNPAISDMAKNSISSLLKCDPDERITIANVQADGWITTNYNIN